MFKVGDTVRLVRLVVGPGEDDVSPEDLMAWAEAGVRLGAVGVVTCVLGRGMGCDVVAKFYTAVGRDFHLYAEEVEKIR